MTRLMCCSLALLVLLPAATAAAEAPPAAPAPRSTVDIQPSGEYLVRFRHFERRDFTSGTTSNFFTHRARLGLKLEYDKRVGVFLQLQDVRIWGEESDTLGDFSAAGLDLHQGFLQVKLAEGLRMRIGRQEIGYLNHRLIGTVGFVEQSRSLDAVRVMYAGMDKKLVLDAFYARVRHNIGVDAGAEDLAALIGQYRVNDAFVPALIAVMDLNGPTDRTRITLGALITGQHESGLSYSVEGYYQLGSAQNDVSFAAFLAALKVRFTFISSSLKPFIEGFGELVSGDDDPADSDVKTFDTLFATNHKFYGEMDFFLNLPAHTGGRGLMDLGASLGLKPHPNVLAQVSLHLFNTMEDRGGESSFGTEIDTKVTWKPMKHLKLDLMYAVFLPGAAFTPDGSTEHFLYTTVGAEF